MKNVLKNSKWYLALMATVIVLAGCSATKKVTTADTGLKYKLAGSESFSYIQEAEITQSVDIGGQEIGSTILTCTGYTLTPGQIAAGVIPLKVTVDTLGLTVQSPQGNIVENKSELKGRQFDMTVSDLGKEDNLDEAEKIKFMVAGQQESNLKSTFLMLFPDLTEIPYKDGVTWTQSDTIDLSTGSDNILMIIHSENIFAGREEFEGYNCIRVNYKLTGERSGYSNTVQGQIGTEGTLAGGGFFLFAPDQGILVRDESRVTMEGYVSIPTGDSFPLMAITKYVTKLVK